MEQVNINLIKAYIAQMESAVKISKVLLDHNNDSDELSGDDIICGLVYRLMTPLTEREMSESLREADEIFNKDYSSDEEEYDSIEEKYEKPEISRKIKTNNCNCDICSKVRVCLLNFKNYEPNDELAQRFKDSIAETCEIHKIYI